ncbi:hypothetical protein BDZ91DRAFT_734761 [Kalaharituber pfeilii]|nr:hypothetical protein BDZ91DRAFT_734761 [Kalaharituber pfeilii]
MVEATKVPGNPLPLLELMGAENLGSMDTSILVRILSIIKGKLQPIYKEEDEYGSKCRLVLNTVGNF